MKYEILQVKKDLIAKYGFDSYEWAMKKDFDINHYEKVYEGEILDIANDDVICEVLFERFNISRPADFKGHSLSVSDIIVLDGRKYYTDRIGFKRLS